MTPSEARELLAIHSGEAEDAEGGFLGRFRYFSGTLPEAEYIELLEIIRILHGELRNDPESVSRLWAIMHFTHLWALDPEGMLLRNQLIDPIQTQRIHSWIATIGEEVLTALENPTEE